MKFSNLVVLILLFILFSFICSSANAGRVTIKGEDHSSDLEDLKNVIRERRRPAPRSRETIERDERWRRESEEKSRCRRECEHELKKCYHGCAPLDRWDGGLIEASSRGKCHNRCWDIKHSCELACQ